MPKYTKKLYGEEYVDAWIAEMEGQEYNDRPFSWTDGKNEFSHITGGIVLPKMEQSGFLVTVGVRRTTHRFECLEEHEEIEDEFELVQKARDIQKKYGTGVIQNWWGDARKLMTIINDYRKEKNPVLISDPIDFDLEDCLQIYYARLMVAIHTTVKELYFNDCKVMKSNVLAFNKDRRATIENSPCVAMLGWLIHTLHAGRPWENAVKHVPLVATGINSESYYEDELDIHEELYGGKE